MEDFKNGELIQVRDYNCDEWRERIFVGLYTGSNTFPYVVCGGDNDGRTYRYKQARKIVEHKESFIFHHIQDRHSTVVVFESREELRTYIKDNLCG